MEDLVSGQSKLRLLFVTVAFGIGVDVHDIHRIIHIGVPHTIEEYF
jgi:superfamily II DNA helicase RecQ